MERQELEKAYTQYIDELAQDALAKKPINQNLLDIVAKIQCNMRDLDIVEAMRKHRESTIPSIDEMQTSKNFTINEFGEIIRGEEMISSNVSTATQPDYSENYQHKTR